jgi:hypothetical protein
VGSDVCATAGGIAGFEVAHARPSARPIIGSTKLRS